MPSSMVSTTTEDLECVLMCAQFDGIILSIFASETPFVLMKGPWISVSYITGTPSKQMLALFCLTEPFIGWDTPARAQTGLLL